MAAAHRSRYLDYSPRMSMHSKEVKLKLWVFKIVFGQFEVCVEGYRPKDPEETELKCWHSTAIADRINSCTLQTKSGSVYTLHGPMDTDAAQVYGYPDDLIEAFKNGFPPNWRELLSDFHAMLVRSSQCDVSQWFNSSLMAERRRSSMNVSRRQSATFPSLTDAVNKFSREKQLAPADRRSFRSRQSFLIPASAPMTPVAEDRTAERSASSFDQGEQLLHRTENSPLAPVLQASPLTAVRSSPRLSSAAPVEQIVEVAQNDEDVIAGATSPMHIGRAKFESTKMDSPPANDENQPPPPTAVDLNVFKMPTMPAPKPRKGKNVPAEIAPKTANPDSPVDPSTIVPSVVLQDWVFKLVNGDFAVCLEGYRTDAPDKCWHSTAIVERVSARLLKTGSGTVYGLEGPIDTNAAADPYGYPKYLVSLFEHGFPPDWKEILTEFYESRIQTNQTNVSQWFAADQPVDQSMMEATLPLADAVDRVSRKKQLDVVSSNVADGGQQASSSTISSKKQEDFIFAKPSMPAPKSKKKPGQKKWDTQSLHSDFGEISARLSASADGDNLFRASRSGRVIKPPLASWAGQRITYDQDGKAKHVVDPITEVATQRHGFSLAALCQVYGVSPVRQPIQQERRISLAQPSKKKKKRRSDDRSTRRTVDEGSDSSDASSLSSSSEESDSPIGKRRNKTTSRFRFDDSAEYELEREERRQRRKEKRRRRKERELEKQKKVRRAQSTTSRSTKRRSPAKKKPAAAKSTTSKMSRSTKGRGRAAQSTASHRRRSRSASSLSQSLSHSPSPSPPPKKAKKPAAKRWTNEEYKRLQIALRAVLPRDDDGWNKVANSLGGERTAAQCRNAANRVLGYDLQLQDEDLPQSAAPQITAKVGTAAYQVQANRYLHSYLHGTGDDDDYFENTCDMAASTLALPSLGDLNPNDSLLSVMFTPTNVPRGKNRVFVPRPASTPGSAVMSPAYDQSPASVLDSASRDRKARYAHQLLQERVERMAMIARKKQTRESLSGANNKKAKEARQQDELLSRYLNDVRRKHDDDDEESENDDQYFSEEGDSD